MKIFVFIAALSSTVLASTETISRQDGFLLLWETIRRPAFETIYVEPYADLPEDAEGYKEITWGKRRKILPDTHEFRPSDPLLLGDALQWLFLTRNSAEPGVDSFGIAALLLRYPILSEEIDMKRPVKGRGELLKIIRDLDNALREEVHLVSFYADDFHGKGTAFGEVFNMHEITAAHRTFPHNTLVRVTNQENGKSVVVRINDRGPYIEGRNMDLSLASFLEISPRSRGVISARFERLGDKDLVDACKLHAKFQKRITRDIRFNRGVPHNMLFGETLTLDANRYFVVRSITEPDGYIQRVESWVHPDEKYSYTPKQVGDYVFHITTGDGRRREMRMRVGNC